MTKHTEKNERKLTLIIIALQVTSLFNFIKLGKFKNFQKFQKPESNFLPLLTHYIYVTLLFLLVHFFPLSPLPLRCSNRYFNRICKFKSTMGQIQYSEKYFDDTFEYRHVVLPPEVAKLLPKNRLLSESEWRAIGVQQSRGWVHYAIHRPEPHIMLFRRPLNYQQNQENQAQAHQSVLAK
ncbi:putative cyclin-dependent kinase, regulatory subunit [Helianthus anomalus]